MSNTLFSASALPPGHGTAETTQATSAGQAPRVPRRRRLWLAGLATILVAAAVGGNYALITTLNHREPVLVLTRDVGWGQPITGADVTTVAASAQVQRFAIPAARRGQVIGRIAATNLPAGQVLSPREVTSQVVPGPGQRLLGLRVKAGHLPARGLHPNDPIEVIPAASPSTVGTPSGPPAGAGFPARVVQTAPPDTDAAVTVDVLIDDTMTGQASAAAAGDVLVMLLGPDH